MRISISARQRSRQVFGAGEAKDLPSAVVT
jgi:hypothetical protein